MQFEELKKRALTSPAAPLRGDDFDAFRRDVLAFFAKVPEPPLYRRRDDPAKRAAAQLADDGAKLLSRGAHLGATAAPWVAALEQHLRALCLVADGKIEAAESEWNRAVALERQATAALRLWKRSDEGSRPVYDAETRVSRFDPQPDALVTAKLACPQCRKVADYRFSPLAAQHHFSCVHCGFAFDVYFAEVRSVEVRDFSSSHRRYVCRVEELAGAETRIEFDDYGTGVLTAAHRDLLAFFYAPKEHLRGVLNLNSSRVLWLPSKGPCFVASVAYESPDASQLVVLRAFRDEVLMPSSVGRAFVGWYYRHGPRLASWVHRRALRRRLTRLVLDRIVWALRVTRETA